MIYNKVGRSIPYGSMYLDLVAELFSRMKRGKKEKRNTMWNEIENRIMHVKLR